MTMADYWNRVDAYVANNHHAGQGLAALGKVRGRPSTFNILLFCGCWAVVSFYPDIIIEENGTLSTDSFCIEKKYWFREEVAFKNHAFRALIECAQSREIRRLERAGRITVNPMVFAPDNVIWTGTRPS